MTLHEAIKAVLRKSRSELSTKEIAFQINRLKLYKRGDGKEIPAGQISARINRYLNYFRKLDNQRPYKYTLN